MYQSDYDGQYYDSPDEEERARHPQDPYQAGVNLQSQPAPSQASSAPAFGGFNAGNVFSSWDLNPIAAQTGVSRDELSNQRDAFLQPKYQGFRDAARQQGGRASESDQDLFSDAGFQQYVQTGQYQAPQAPRTFQNSAPTFDDPASRLVEDSALARYQHLQNPDPNSGTALFEKYARQLMDTLQQPAYSPQDESIIKGKALDSIMVEKDQTKRRWLEELSRRGLSPSSGPALEGLQRIEQHYSGLQTQVESEFARKAIDDTRAQRFQTLSTAGQLAGSEEGRLREALTYAGIPLELQNNAFQRNLQLVGAGGTPQSMVNTLMQLATYGQSQDAYRSQQQQQMVSGLMQYLGYVMGGGR